MFDEIPWTMDQAWRLLCHCHDEIVLAFAGGLGVLQDRWLVVTWRPPPQGYVKLDIDGSHHDRTEVMGAGGLIRDSQGRWLASFATHRQGGNALMAEAVALHLGLQFAWEKGFRDVLCETDCKELFNLLEDQSAYGFMPILLRIKEVLQSEWTVQL